MKMTMEQTILMDQLTHLGIYKNFSVKNTLYNSNKSEESQWDLRLCIRQPPIVVNVDITYDRGADLYNVKAYLLRNYGLQIDTVYDTKGLFWDQFPDIFQSIMAKARKEFALGTIKKVVLE